VTANLQTVTEIVERMEQRSKFIDASLKVADDRFERSLQELRDAVAEIGKARKRR
jgi:exonuclease VII small subunit